MTIEVYVSQAEREVTAVARSAAHVVFLLPHDDNVVPQFLGAALERIAPDAGALQGLILTPDTETALAIARASLAGSVRVVPLTSPGRGARLLRAAGKLPLAVAATPGVIASLMRTASIPLRDVRTLVIAWADEMLDVRESGALETVMADVPKESARTLVTATSSPEIDALIERYLRRPRRIGPAAPALEAAMPLLRHVETSRAARPAALRRLLDELDPPSAAIIVQAEDSAAEVRDTLRILGYDDDASLPVVRGAPASPATTFVFYDLPPTADVLAQAAALAPTVLIVFATPRQLPALRQMAGGDVPPLATSPAVAKARTHDERMRAMLRAELAAGLPAREVLAIEPLLEEFDGVEIAAAALRVLERERVAVRAASPARPTVAMPVSAAAPAAPSGAMTRVFFNVGARDGVRAADLVGAIANETGIGRTEIGRIAVRESHAIVEIASSVSASVIDKMNGVVVRGRRIAARVDAGADRARPAPRGGFGGGGARGKGGGGGSGRHERHGGARDGRRERQGGASDSARGGRSPRLMRERNEWAERGERVRHARRRPDGDREG